MNDKEVTQLFDKLNTIERLLNNRTTPQPEADQLLTIKEAADVLHLSVPTLYSYVSRNEIPFSKKSKRLYFSKQELFDWIKQGRKKTLGEIAGESNTYLKGKKK